MARPIDLAAVLKALVGEYGMQEVASAVRKAFQAWLKSAKRDFGGNQEVFLESYSARYEFAKIRAAANGRSIGQDLELHHIVRFVKKVKMPPHVLLAAMIPDKPFPFEGFRQGSTITVFVATRMASNNEGEGKKAGWQRACHGSRDVQAVADLANFLSRETNLEYELEIVAVPQEMQVKARGFFEAYSATKRLQECIENPRTGAIVSLGSGPHNSVSNAMAPMIFNDCDGDPPVQFRWADEKRNGVDFLKERTPWLRERLPLPATGIWVIEDSQASLLCRETDWAIKDYFDPEEEHGTELPEYFSDCGMLAIDVRGRVPLILAAGHGGNATRACVQGLRETDMIEKAARESPMKGRFIGCLVVSRVKDSKELVDDVKLPATSDGQRSWYFHGIEKAPTSYGLDQLTPFTVNLP